MNQKELIEKINKAANIISKKARNGDSEYIVVSPDVANRIDEINIQFDAYNKNDERLKKLNEILNEPE